MPFISIGWNVFLVRILYPKMNKLLLAIEYDYGEDGL